MPRPLPPPLCHSVLNGYTPPSPYFNKFFWTAPKARLVQLSFGGPQKM